MARQHLAQLNVGRLAHDKDDPRLAEFMDNLALVNGIAERSPGFVWRFTDDGGCSATDAAFDPGDPRVILNLSLWETPQALEDFVWKTVHKRFYQRRAAWFETMTESHFVMWWVAAGHRPDPLEAQARLARLRAEGPGPEAFGWESLSSATLWRSARCA